MDIIRSQKTTKQRSRDVFNDEFFNSSLHKRTTHTMLCYDEPAPPSSGEPEGSMSQIHDYIDGNGNKLATIHRYRRPDGSIGGSGKLDPHALMIDGVLLYDP
jgi:hypothetical protein